MSVFLIAKGNRENESDAGAAMGGGRQRGSRDEGEQVRGFGKELRSAGGAKLRIGVLCLAALLASLALASSASAATYFHPFVSQFGPDGTASTNFFKDKSVAIDEGSHDVFVADTRGSVEGQGVVYRFTASGAPHNFTEGPGAGTNKLPGFTLDGFQSQIAVALPASPGGTAGDLSVASGSTYSQATNSY